MAKRNLLDPSHLIPHSDFITGFTTCELVDHPKIENVMLDDRQLGLHKVSSGTTHHVVQLPTSPDVTGAPKTAWEAFYPQGSVNPSGEIPGGFGFYLAGPSAFAKRLEIASEAMFSYRMMLQEDWEWVKGGKLPGICTSCLIRRLSLTYWCSILVGGVGNLAYECTGGRQDKRCQCFDLRVMWRTGSVGELYAYLPLTSDNATQLSAVPPRSVVNNDYGFSVGRGAFHLDCALGNWVSIAFRIKLNDVGSENGELEIRVDGNSVIKVDGLTIRTTENGRIKGMHFQTFFGGHGNDWASPKDQRAWFADVTGVILQ